MAMKRKISLSFSLFFIPEFFFFFNARKTRRKRETHGKYKNVKVKYVVAANGYPMIVVKIYGSIEIMACTQ